VVTLPRGLLAVGTLLEIVGVSLVFWQVAKAERDLGLKPWWREVRPRARREITRPVRWFRAHFGRRPSKQVTVNVTAHGLSVASGSATVRVRSGRGGDTGQQLSSLWAETDRLREQLDQIRAEMQSGRAGVLQQLAEARAESERALTDLTERFARLGRSSRTPQVFGALFIVAGLILVGLAGWLT
jgi:hypothetical protein